ncbi:MAG TPA: hypothetical protein VGI39_08695 [Polyangiaceae bacterium]|jgi:DNA-binding transcriptional LysR family regulator
MANYACPSYLRKYGVPAKLEDLIIQAPRWRRREALERGLLVEVLPELTCAPMPVSLVHAHGRNVPKRVRAVMAWLAKTVEPFLEH